jgi:hypothetical protein
MFRGGWWADGKFHPALDYKASLAVGRTFFPAGHGSCVLGVELAAELLEAVACTRRQSQSCYLPVTRAGVDFTQRSAGSWGTPFTAGEGGPERSRSAIRGLRRPGVLIFAGSSSPRRHMNRLVWLHPARGILMSITSLYCRQ